MIFYVTVLRFLAAMIITNSHYVDVYPTDLLANGGLLGDVIFFAVSGFCLYNIKDKFFRWYGKRITRIYPIVWSITILYIWLGFYNFKDMNFFEYFIYPTYYHFIASIMVLYIPYYFVMKIHFLNKNIDKIIIFSFLIELIIYIFLYDKTYYHIDVVKEPMIRFLFFNSMMLGAYFRQNNEKYINKNEIKNGIFVLILFVIYFASKISFSKLNMISQYQIVNQIILFILLYFIMKFFAGVNSKLDSLKSNLKKFIKFIADMTLEIYVVQYAIIPKLTNLVFPINWFVITFTILVSAVLLHVFLNKLIAFFKKKIFRISEV